jgi:hypothetical protein
MPLHALSDDERRSHCRREIEALEHWLRRLVHETFSEVYGTAYLDAVGDDGNRLFKSETAKAIEARQGRDPSRYPRRIDAAHLDDLVKLICKSENYRRHFRSALGAVFPQGNEEARTYLTRVVEVRHKLSHANPITVHDAARVICYTQDVLASLKEHYAAMNEQREYNVPMIIKVADSLGNAFQDTGIARNSADFAEFNFYKTGSGRLYPGDRLAVEVEVDPTFERSSYQLHWGWPGNQSSQFADTERVVIDIENSHVRERFSVKCRIISNRAWQRHGTHDDMVILSYKVLPPPA